MGKGLMTLNPFYSDSFLLNKVGMAGLLIVFHSALDLKNSILNKRHYLLFSLATTVRPRCLITVDQDGKSIPGK
jgi:26S proteasome regulatory subunit N1